MKQIIKFLPLLSLVLLLAACTKPTVVIDEDTTGSENNAQTLSGEIDAGTVARSVVVGDNYKYLWGNAKTDTVNQTLTLYFKSKTGAALGFYSATTKLKIKYDGSCTFSGVTLPSGFVVNQDSIAGAIGVTSVPATGRWQFQTPTTIDASGSTYIPMFFPPTLVIPVTGVPGTTAKVSAAFKTLGSVLAFEITNETGTAYSPVTFTTQSRSFRTNGTVSWAIANRLPGDFPDFTANAVGADTSVTITVSNMTIAPTKKDTLYVWVAQNGSTLARMLTRMRRTTVTSGTPTDEADRITVLKDARPSTLANNGFYMVRMTVQSDLMITEVAEANYTVSGGSRGGFYEIYNGSNYTVDLKDYWIDGSQTSNAYAPMPVSWKSYPLASKALVTLVIPPSDATTQTTLNDFVNNFAKKDTIWLGKLGSGNAASNYFRPFYQGRLIRLGKYLYPTPATPIAAGTGADAAATADNSWVIDFVNLTNWYGNTSVTGVRRKTGILFPTPISDASLTQWTTVTTADYSNFGTR